MTGVHMRLLMPQIQNLVWLESTSPDVWCKFGCSSCCSVEVGGGDIGGGLAADLTLETRLRFGGRAGGCTDVSFRGEPSTSVLKHASHLDGHVQLASSHTLHLYSCVQANSLNNVYHTAPTCLAASLNWGMKPWRRNKTGLMSVTIPAAATRPATSCRCVPSGAGTHWCLDVHSFRTSPCTPLLQQQAKKYISLSHKAFGLCSGYCWHLDFAVATVDISPSKFCIYFCSSIWATRSTYFSVLSSAGCVTTAVSHTLQQASTLCKSSLSQLLPPPHKMTCINSKASGYVGSSSYPPTSSPVIVICCQILKTNSPPNKWTHFTNTQQDKLKMQVFLSQNTTLLFNKSATCVGCYHYPPLSWSQQ
jgi:hypothetical protein